MRIHEVFLPNEGNEKSNKNQGITSLTFESRSLLIVYMLYFFNIGIHFKHW